MLKAQPRMSTRICSATSLASLSLIAALALAGCSSTGKKAEPEVAVRTGVVQKATIQGTIETEAVLYPLHQAAITPKITTPVKEFLVNRGSRVHKGQLLAVLENRDLTGAEIESQGAYQQAQAEYASATATTLPEELQKAEADANSAKQAYEAEQKVYNSRQMLYQQGALPRKELDQSGVSLTQAKNNYEIAQRHLSALRAGASQEHRKAAQGQLTAAKGKYLNSAAQLGYTKIESPIDGVVTDRPIYPGETPPVGTPLLVVMDASRVIAKAHIASDQANRIKAGTGGSIFAAGMDQPIRGKVSLVSPALDPNSTTVEVWVEATNQEGHLRPGSTIHVSIVTDTAKDALVIPTSALLTSADGATTVMTVSADGHAHQQPVEVGIRQPKQVQITKGLKAGDKVIISGAYGLPDNTKVKEETSESKPGTDTKSEGN